MRVLISIGGGFFFILYFLFHFGYRNVNEVKDVAEYVWSENGFEVKGYEGYEWSLVRGGDVWYILTRCNDNSVIYNGFLCKWRDEYHIYNLEAIDAIGSNR